ncbi:MAG: hypothetical protein GTO41_20480 [Burkholderiales bacterium]|nr:hypothetical protein [Burkholderiales bacterium]
MCGRYALSSTPAQINARFAVRVYPDWKPSYNVAPGTQVMIVHAQAAAGTRVAEPAHWGFTPSWLKPDGRGPRPINARCESVADKPMFRNAFAQRRCILPADGFYEWKRLDHRKQPWLIRMRDGGVFGFAGIYEPGNKITANRPSCAILTTGANELMDPIHSRMPVILTPDDYERWLDTTEQHAAVLEKFLHPYEGQDLIAYPVSERVNNTRNNDEALTHPA